MLVSRRLFNLATPQLSPFRHLTSLDEALSVRRDSLSFTELAMLTQRAQQLSFGANKGWGTDVRVKGLVSEIASRLESGACETLDAHLLEVVSSSLHRLSKFGGVTEAKIPAFKLRELFLENRHSMEIKRVLAVVLYLNECRVLDRDLYAECLSALTRGVESMGPYEIVSALDLLEIGNRQISGSAAELLTGCIHRARVVGGWNANTASDVLGKAASFPGQLRGPGMRSGLTQLFEESINGWQDLSLRRKVGVLKAASNLSLRAQPERMQNGTGSENWLNLAVSSTLTEAISGTDPENSGNGIKSKSEQIVQIIRSAAVLCPAAHFQGEEISRSLTNALNFLTRVNPFMLTPQLQGDLLWSLVVLEKGNSPLVKMIADRITATVKQKVVDGSESEKVEEVHPFIVRYPSRASRQLLDVHACLSTASKFPVFDKSAFFQSQGIFSPQTVTALESADAEFFDKSTCKFQVFKSVKEVATGLVDPHLYPQGLKIEEKVKIGSLTVPMYIRKLNLVIDVDTCTDGYNFRLRKAAMKKMRVKYMVVSDRMWKAVGYAKNHELYLRQSISSAIRGGRNMYTITQNK